MTSVNMPRDDAATVVNTKALSEHNVKAVDAAPTVQPVKAHEDVMAAPQRRTPARKAEQRRKQERRKEKRAVLLDTRSGRDRRNALHGDRPEIEGEAPTGNTGIDVYT
jgi:hypothetical protein